MRVLLDTHVFLWWIENSSNLSRRAKQVIANADNEILVSAASGWEIAIKSQLGKLRLASAAENFIAEQLMVNAFQSLAISMSHALHVTTLLSLHRDPFDRMLVSQSQLEQLPIITADPLIVQYGIEHIW